MPSADDIAQGYGWELSVINSNPELKRLFHLAEKHNWTTEKFQAEVRDSKFFRTHGESWRRMFTLEHGVDPGQYQKMHHDMWQRLRDAAQQMGANISSSLMSRIAKTALYNDWSDGEIRDKIGHYVGLYSGRLFGDAANTGMQLRATALANGVKVNSKQVRTWAGQVARGSSTVESLQNWMRLQSAKSFPTFAKELESGVDLQDLAAPYTQAMSTLWEMNPAEVDMFNPTIRKALGHRDPKTGHATSLSPADFEDVLRQDPRALKTKWMQDASSATLHDLLKQFHAIAA